MYSSIKPFTKTPLMRSKSDSNSLRKLAFHNRQRRNSDPNPQSPSIHSSSSSSSSSDMPPTTHPRHNPTLPTIPSVSTTPVPDSPSTNPWNPPTPIATLRRQFRLFTEEENARRAHRGETPFCSPDGRERAFAKLMRLSRGEEPIGWRIDSRPDYEDLEDGHCCAMCDQQAWDKEDDGDDAVMVDAGVADDDKDQGRQERKDSTQTVVVAGGGWRRLVGRVVGFGAQQAQEEEHNSMGRDRSMAAEHIEDVAAEGKN